MNIDVYLQKAKNYIYNQRYEEAETLLSKIDNKASSQVLNLWGLLYDQKAAGTKDQTERSKLQKRAMRYLKRSLQIDSKNPITYLYLGHIYHHKASIKTQKPRLKAIEYYQKAFDSGLDKYQANLNLGNAYRRFNKPVEAEKYYLKARTLAKTLQNRINILFNLTYFYFEQNDLEKSKDYYKEFNTMVKKMKNGKTIKLLQENLRQLFPSID